MIQFYWFILGAFAVWRITTIFNSEDGPFDIFVRFRSLFGNGVLGKLLDCFYCLSLWIAAPVAYMIGTQWKERLLLWFALSGAAIIIERTTKKGNLETHTLYYEEEEDNNGLLLREEKCTRGKDAVDPDEH